MAAMRTGKATLTLVVLSAALPAAGFAGLSIFADGFEVCDASRWTSATGLPDCSANLVCPLQEPGESCVAGRIFDLETSEPLCATTVTTDACTAVGQGGACALEINAYDGLAFFTNPSGTSPLATEQHVVDGCGRFLLSGFPIPPGVYTAIASDDASGAGDLHRLTADVVFLPLGSGIVGFRSYALSVATDQAWTTSAGSPFGSDTFADLGAFAPIFLYGATPVAGVQIRVNGAAVPDDDYYFSDTEPFRRSVVDVAASSTGANGTGLVVESSLTGHSGSGNEPTGCVWPAILADSSPGLVMTREMRAEVAGQPGVACP
jgi:hypothetical protein